LKFVKSWEEETEATSIDAFELGNIDKYNEGATEGAEEGL
jgi:hypothetical protein